MVNAALTRLRRSKAIAELKTVKTNPAADSWSIFSDRN